MTAIGTIDFPAPLNSPAMAWERARTKRKKEDIRAFSTPMAMTFASWLNRDTKGAA